MEGKIYNAVISVMAEIGAVGKNDINKQQGFKYRSIDAVMNALHPAMAKYKIFCVPEVLEQTREERTSGKGNLLIYSICKIRFRFYAEDGSFIDAVTIGEGMDSGDKATNKAMAIAFKYACFQVFCIPTEEMQDPDGESPSPQPKASQSTQRSNVKCITSEDVTKIEAELNRTGIDAGVVLEMLHVNKFEEINEIQFKALMNKFAKTKDRQDGM